MWGVERQRKWGGASNSEIKIVKKELALREGETRNQEDRGGN